MSEDNIRLTNLINAAVIDLTQGKISADFLDYTLDSNAEINDETRELYFNVKIIINKFKESNEFINALSKGDLNIEPPPRNYIISQFKQLHSNLLHLTWQTQQIASGDYSQKVSFLGDFSVAFNQLINTLKDKKKLEDDLKASEQNFRDLNSLKDKMFSIVGHDLRGPIGNIKSLIDLIIESDDYSDIEQLKEYLLLLQNASGSAFNLLENLLSWARSQKNDIQIIPGFFKLNDIIDENINLLAPNASNKNIKLISALPRIFVAYFDLQTINVVIRNLISNALKFTPKNGTVTINVMKIEKQMEIQVIDTGVGISDENLKNIFNPSRHFTTMGTDNEHGSGIGLLLCKDFVEKNGGKLTVESQLSKGSTFKFTLPLCG
jgi:signal transduction histidine kinase